MDDTGLKISPETPLPLSTQDSSWFVPLREDRPELLDMGEGSRSMMPPQAWQICGASTVLLADYTR
jgi:hypothetical protein